MSFAFILRNFFTRATIRPFSRFCAVAINLNVNNLNSVLVQWQSHRLLGPTSTEVKNYCKTSNANEISIAYYDEIKSLPNHPEKLLIDVREPEELKESGQIPTSINIPLAEVQSALSSSTDKETFKKLYGVPKPLKDQYIIFHCLIGKRSNKASEIATKLGFKNVKNYLGSWTEWVEREKNNQTLDNVHKARSNVTSNDEFEKLYCRPKPKFDSIIIFSCKSGKRALKASQDVNALGYSNIKTYAGSWIDWAEHEHLPK